MVYGTAMPLPIPPTVPTTPSDFPYHHTPRRSESVGSSFGIQNPHTASPFSFPSDYGLHSSRGGTPFDNSSDGPGSLAHGHMVPTGGLTTLYPGMPLIGRVSGVNRYISKSNGTLQHPEIQGSNMAESFTHGSPSTELVALQTEIRVLRSALSGILAAMPEILALSRVALPDNFVVPDPAPYVTRLRESGVAVTNGPLRTRDPLPVVKRTDVPLVTIWTAQDWAEVAKDDDVTDPNQVKKKKGKTNAYLGFNMTMKYVQDESGHVISGYYASEIRDVAYQMWYELLLRGLAPPKWSHITLCAADFYYQEMAYRFPPLRFCGGSPAHWKARQIATDNYPAFVQGLSRKNMAHLLRPMALAAIAPGPAVADITPAEPESESEMVLLSDLPPASRLKRQPPNRTAGLQATGSAAKRQKRISATNIPTRSTITAGLQDSLADIFTETLPPSSSDTIDQHHTGPAAVPNSADCATSQDDSQCGTRPTSTQSMQPAPIAIDNMTLERVPSCNRSLTPSHNDPEETISAAENISPDTATNHVEGGIAGVSASTPALTFVMTDEASIAPSAEQSMTAGLVPGTAISLSTTEAGPVALWPLRTITARNLCGYQWKERTLDGSKKDFDVYWKQLSKSDRRIYNDQAKDMKAAQTARGANRTPN